MSMYQNYYAQPSYGSQTYAQPPVANGYHQFPPQASYPVDPTTFRRDFSNRLSELTMNSRPIIQSLSMYAHDYVRFAEIVAQCLETHIRRVPPWMKLPSFYLLDMISKNIFEPYARLFSTFVIPLFLETYQQVDEATRSKMVELVLTWRTGSPTGKELFGVPAQVQIERSIWGETSSSPASTSQSNGFITKSQVLSELEFTLGQKERAVQANPSDTTSQNHVHVLHQLRRLVEAGVSQEELKQILSQLRNLMRSNVTPTISQPSQVAPTSTSQWPSQSYTAPQTSLPPAATYPYAYPAIKTEDAVPSKPILPISSVPAVPAGGFANLLSSLVKSGILSNTGTPLGAGATAKDESSNSVDEEREASRTHRAFVLRHPVQLSTAGITKGRPPISEMLYDHLASQCKQCGLRFPDTVSGKKLLEDHLDMHFKQNMKANLNIGRGHSRSWYTSVDDWVHDTTDRKGKGRADGSRPLSSKAAAAADAAKRDAELRAQFVIVPPGDEAKPISCPICKEALKSEFLEDDEEWVWRNAIKKDERIYHATCHAEASTNTLASRLLNTGRSRSITPEAQVLAVKKSSPSPESLAGVKRKAGDDHSPLSQFEGTPPSKKLAISA